MVGVEQLLKWATHPSRTLYSYADVEGNRLRYTPTRLERPDEGWFERDPAQARGRWSPERLQTAAEVIDRTSRREDTDVRRPRAVLGVRHMRNVGV